LAHIWDTRRYMPQDGNVVKKSDHDVTTYIDSTEYSFVRLYPVIVLSDNPSRASLVVRALGYKPKVAGSRPDVVKF
jgi:hypothetical protein